MLILFDHGTPRGIARFLLGHTVIRAKQRGWDTLSNGDLLAEAERAGFDVFVTADKNIQYQQNLSGRKIAVVVLSTPQWPLGSIAHRKNCGGGQLGHAWAAMSKFIFHIGHDAPGRAPSRKAREGAHPGNNYHFVQFSKAKNQAKNPALSRTRSEAPFRILGESQARFTLPYG